MGHGMNSLLRMNVVETWFVAVWGLCWCNLFHIHLHDVMVLGAQPRKGPPIAYVPRPHAPWFVEKS